MKTIIFQILHYLWIKRDKIFELYKVINADGKINFKDFKNIIDYYEKAGFIPEENDEIFVGGITKVETNKSKNLVQYDQSNYACAIYSRTRVVMYNVKGLVYSKDEVEAIVALAKAKGYLKTTGDSKGMTFANADKVITEWTLKNKGIQLKYDKVAYGGAEDKSRVALGYSRSIGGGISGKYLKDFRFDGKIDEDYSFDEKILYYHAFTQEDDMLVTENYPTQFGNNNRYQNHLVSDFVSNKVFFGWAYYIFSDQEIVSDNIEEKKEEHKLSKFSPAEQIEIKNLLKVLGDRIKSGYVRIFNTLIVDSFEETKTRILQEIYGARLEERLKNK